jgi:hypothetical protein
LQACHTQKAQLLGNIGNNNVMMMMMMMLHGKKENFTCGKVCFSVMLGDCTLSDTEVNCKE